jgi:cholesterol oxidase
MSVTLSKSIEQLIVRATTDGDNWSPREPIGRADVIIVGSGYGASVAASRIAGATKSGGDPVSVMILERGREYSLGEFPEDMGMLPRHVRIQTDAGDDAPPRSIGYADGLFDFRVSNDVNLLLGNGLGGGSLINASVAEIPEEAHFSAMDVPKAWHNYHQTGNFRADADRIVNLLGASRQESPSDLKFDALKRLAKAIGATAESANLAVSFQNGPNSVGVTQPECIRCGNCVTGCNTGAKSTLAMNLLPLARQKGADIYTGVTVVAVRKAPEDKDHPWRVIIQRTQASRTEQAIDGGPAEWEIAAGQVILAAGALGSTEILMRSKTEDLRFSEKLGDRFSTNGDGIAMGFAQRSKVNPVGTSRQGAPANIGPTISGILRVRLASDGSRIESGGTPVTIEDGAIPGSLRHVFGEMLVTAALFNRLGRGGLPAWLVEKSSSKPRPDPLASSDEVIAHSQLLLIMGDDKAAGRLRLCGNGHAAGVAVRWKEAGRNPTLTSVDACFERQNLAAGFDEGQYVPNPAWRLLPAEATESMSGKQPGGGTVSVHPLGGCAAADNGTAGVVNDACQVFDGSGTALHDGLYVMDGAVIPGALAVNPFLTISVIAWRATGILIAANKWVEMDTLSAQVQAPLNTPAHTQVATLETGAVALDFHEMMQGQVKDVLPPWVMAALPASATWREPAGLSVRGTLQVNDLDSWLENPGATTLFGRCQLNSITGADWMQAGKTEVTLLSTDHPDRLLRLRRAARALLAYRKRRGSDFDSSTLLTDLFNGKVKGFLSLAMDHAHHRLMNYRFAWDSGSTAGSPSIQIVIDGEKRLAYESGNRHVFEAMTVLDAKLKITQGAKVFTSDPFEMRVDLGDMVRNTPPQLTDMPHLPAALQSLGRLGAFAARCIVQTSFWEFGANDYPKNDDLQHPDPRPLPIRGKHGENVLPVPYLIRVPLKRMDRTEADGRALDALLLSPVREGSELPDKDFDMRLLHYPQPDYAVTRSDPVVLLHGLAQGSRIFTTELETNMASALWRAGFDVWLVDYRLSNLVLPGLKVLDWHLEDIAENDVTGALKFVHEHYLSKRGEEPNIRVFAHCVGATALSMALLKGWLNGIGLSHISLNAIHPWIEPSLGNDLRARLGTLARDALQQSMLDPRPSQTPSVAETLFDRFAMAVARYQEARMEGKSAGEYPPGDDAPHHRTDKEAGVERALCDRMTLLYGRMWKHGNLDPRTHRDFLQMIGPAPVSIYNQLYYLCRRKRITDREGENRFLLEASVQDYWKPETLFIHGEDSEVFHPQSATRSAVRLKIVLEKRGAAQRIKIKRFPGQGHMDVIFSRKAASTVYPLLANFFNGTASDQDFDRVDESMDPAWPAPLAPLTGPFIRHARRNANGSVSVRLWAELNGYSTSYGRLVRFGHKRDDPAPEQGNHRWVEAAINAGASGNIKLSIEYRGLGVEWPELYRRPTGGATANLRPGALARLNIAMTQQSDTTNDDGKDEGGETTSPEGGIVLPLSTFPWFRRMQEGERKALHILVGSCRYPAQLMDGDMADSIFEGMLKHVADDDIRGPGADMAFFVGDQIYADATAGLVDSDDWRERYVERYRRAFSSPRFSKLGRCLPLHFTVDDHEIDDQWSGDPVANSRTTKAREVARLYQQTDWSHGPNRFWYALHFPSESACPIFVMDTRFEREFRHAGNLKTAQMIGTAQRDAIKTWLDRCKDFDGPKFIVSSVVLAPISHRLRDSNNVIDLMTGNSWNEDGWAGYPETLSWMIEELVERETQNVVFVGGDLHLSSVARLVLKAKGKELKATQIVSSGLYAPLPLANMQPGDVAMNADVKVESNVSFDYELTVLSSAQRHFIRIDAQRSAAIVASPWTLKVMACDERGAKIGQPMVVAL